MSAPTVTQREPLLTVATITTAVTAVLALVVALGVDLDPEVQTAILGVVAVAAPLVVGAIARSRVTPADPAARHLTDG